MRLIFLSCIKSDGAKPDTSEAQDASSSKRPRKGSQFDASYHQTQMDSNHNSSRRGSQHSKTPEEPVEIMDVVESDSAMTRVTRSHRQVDNNNTNSNSGSSSLRLRFTFNGADNTADTVNIRSRRSTSRQNSSSMETQSSDEDVENEQPTNRFPSRSHNTRNS